MSLWQMPTLRLASRTSSSPMAGTSSSVTAQRSSPTNCSAFTDHLAWECPPGRRGTVAPSTGARSQIVNAAPAPVKQRSGVRVADEPDAARGRVGAVGEQVRRGAVEAERLPRVQREDLEAHGDLELALDQVAELGTGVLQHPVVVGRAGVRW